MRNSWLKEVHPLFRRREEEWIRCERRYKGGMHILSELRRFDWETSTSQTGESRANEFAQQLAVEALLQTLAAYSESHYAARQREATYISFPESFATLVVGHLMRQAPEPDKALIFGNLGTVTRPKGATTPSRAEQVYYNTDGVGNDGSMWDAWWTERMKKAMATGHRWMMVEASRRKPNTRADELRGQRPFLASFSPLQVSNWHYEDGQLQFAVIRTPYRSPRLSGNTLEDNDWQQGYMLLTASGFDGLGPQYRGGGWWKFDKDGSGVDGSAGNWDSTEGQIPFWAHYYQRDEDEMSRNGIFEIGQAAIAHMNLLSAANFDAWDAAGSITWLAGVNSESYNRAMKAIKDGSRFVPLSPINAGDNTVVVPSVTDGSTGAVAGSVFDGRLKSVIDTVRELAAREVTGAPDSSGASKQMGFLDARSPRLQLMASELEASQNIAIHFLERRFGASNPSGSVTWPREFDLAPLMDQIEQFLDSQEKADTRHPLLTARALMSAAEQAGLVGDDDDRSKLLKEIEESVANIRSSVERERSLINGFLGASETNLNQSSGGAG